MLALPFDAVNKLWECITMIEAQEQLKRFTEHDYPNLKTDKRKKLHGELHKIAYPKVKKTKVNNVNQNDINKILGIRNG